MTIDEMLETILFLESRSFAVVTNRITRCRTNPDDSISRAAKRGEAIPVIKHPSSLFYNDFNLFTDDL